VNHIIPFFWKIWVTRAKEIRFLWF
jgi:hypothetical protein